MSIRTTFLVKKIAVLLSMSMAFIGLGVLVDWSEPDKRSSEDVAVQVAEPQSPSRDSQRDGFAGSMAGEITEKIQQAVDRENREEMEQSVPLRQRVESAKTRILEARRIAEDNGIVYSPPPAGTRQQSIKREIETLKARLAELE
jgi:hypothetical protein